MHPDPTTRFSTRAEAYERYRPSYPPAVLQLAKEACGLTPGSRVADIGCGTGLLAGLLLESGCELIGVEPNEQMRHAGERALSRWPGFQTIDGRAEATGLPDASVDLITAGQAFHWFDVERARAEFRRILKPGGWIMLAWNERRPGTAFMEDYEQAIARYAPEKSRIEVQAIARLFGEGDWRQERFDNEQALDNAGLRGRLASSSYAPERGTAGFEALMRSMDELFARHQRNGKVTILYDTLVYYGRPK